MRRRLICSADTEDPQRYSGVNDTVNMKVDSTVHSPHLPLVSLRLSPFSPRCSSLVHSWKSIVSMPSSPASDSVTVYGAVILTIPK